MITILIGLIILIVLIVLRVSIVIVAPLSASIIAFLNDLNIFKVLYNYYLPGFANFIQDYLFIFLLSALLGKIMVSSGDTEMISKFVLKVLDYRYVAVGIFITSAMLVYGGIMGFVLIFTIYPIAKTVFEKVGLSKSLIIASIVAGTVVIAIPMPGSPQIHNLIMMDFFNNVSTAGLKLGILGVLIGTLLTGSYLYFRTNQLIELEKLDNYGFRLPSWKYTVRFLFCIAPLLTVTISLAILNNTPFISLTLGVLVALIKNIKKINILEIIDESISNATIPLMFAASAMGFGEVISNIPVFKEYLNMILNLPFNPYILLGVITNIAAGILGSASGGILLTISTIGEQLPNLGDPEILHRIIIFASTGLDTLPHNSAYLAMLAFTGLKLKNTYFDYFVVTLLVPIITLCILLMIIK